VTAWNTWPGGVTGTILVHSESDPAIDTWAVSVTFDKVRSTKNVKKSNIV
jgi:S-adenosylmethionine/arginine decarboxylase-like enzyme